MQANTCMSSSASAYAPRDGALLFWKASPQAASPHEGGTHVRLLWFLIIGLVYAVSTLLGGILYLDFRVDIRPDLERAGHWPALGFFDLKEHFISIGLALLPAYWVCWRRPRADDPARTRAALTSVLAFIVWWSFLIGHVLNNIRGFGS